MSKHSNDDFFKVLNSMSGKSEFINAVNKLFGFEKPDEKIDNTLVNDYINAINEAANKKLKQIE